MVSGAERRQGRRASLYAALVAYSLLVVGSAVLHHDFACHQTSRTHCAACTWSQIASGIEAGCPTGTWTLPPADRLDGRSVDQPDTLLAVRRSGRSPPLA
jgi:hypothetical protein